MKVLITGGSGRLGGYVCREFSDCDLLLVDLVDPPDEYRRGLPFKKVDLTKFEDCQSTINEFGPDVILALAALPSPTDGNGSKGTPARHGRPAMPFDTTMNVNIMGLYYLLMAAVESNVKTVIQTSSIVSVESDGTRYPYLPLDERNQADLTNSYNYSKVAGELMLKWFSSVHDIQAIGIKPAAIWSPERAQQHAQSPKPVTEWSRWMWHYVDIRDVAWAHRLACDALDRLPKFDSYLVHAADTQAIEDSRELVEKFRPDILETAPVYLRGRQAFYSTEKARNAIGFRPRFSWTDFS